MRSRYTRAFVGLGCTVAVLAVISPGAEAAPGGSSTVTAVAGTGTPGHRGDGGLSVRAELAAPSGIAVDVAGDVFVADTGNCEVRMTAAHSGRHFGLIMKAQHIYTVAGSVCGHRRSTRSSTPALDNPTGVAVDAAGDLFIADASGNRILELPAVSGRAFGLAVRAGHLTTVAGTGTAADPGGAATMVSGQPARQSALDDPEGIAVDAAGDLYIADSAGCQVDEVPAHDDTRLGVAMAAGHLYVVAGTGICGFSGDGGSAVRAQLWSPSAVTVDGDGDLLIADLGNSAVREVPVTAGTYYGVSIGAGDIATVAGQGTYTAYLNDGLGASGPVADVNYPTGLAVDAAGDLFIADSFDRCIREVPAHTGVLYGRSVVANDMYTLLGVLAVGGAAAGDGTRWILTHVTYPYGIAFGPGGSLFFSDQGGNTIRRVTGS